MTKFHSDKWAWMHKIIDEWGKDAPRVAKPWSDIVPASDPNHRDHKKLMKAIKKRDPKVTDLRYGVVYKGI